SRGESRTVPTPPDSDVAEAAPTDPPANDDTSEEEPAETPTGDDSGSSESDDDDAGTSSDDESEPTPPPDSSNDFDPDYQLDALGSVNLRAGPGVRFEIITSVTIEQPLQYLDQSEPTSDPENDELGEGDQWMKF